MNYLKMLDKASDLIAVLSEQGMYVYLNEAFAEKAGSQKDKLIDQSFFRYHPFTPKSMEAFSDSFSTVLNDGEEVTLIMELSSNQELAFYKVNCIRWEEEKVIQLTCKDMTKEYLLEKELTALKERNDLLVEAVDHSGAGLLITDPNQDDNPIIYMNKGFETMTGYKENEILGQNCRFLQGENSNREAIKEIREAIERKEDIQIEILNYKKAGQPFWNELIINPVKTKQGELDYFIGVQQDITKRKLLELDLEKDLALARTVQQMLLSPQLNDDRLKATGFYQPSSKLGGDLYKWKKIDQDKYAVFLMDVMGHGVAASLLTMSVEAILSTLTDSGSAAPSAVIAKLNDHMNEIFMDYSTDQAIKPYFSCIYLLIDTNNREIQYVNAGHPSFLYREKDGTELKQSTSIPVGLMSAYEWEENRMTYQPGAELFLYTDGFTDALSLTATELQKMELKRSTVADADDFFDLEDANDDVTLVHLELN